MKRIVEIVPNFSEGRRPEIIDQICTVMTAVRGAVLLDKEMNPDHNRAVVTLIGEPQACAEAAFRGISKAKELIDLTKHSGEHPRIGATDVCPFVPISGISEGECVELARNLARRVAEELRIPTYLYELAALRKDRTDLAEIRKGEFEGLREAIRTDPSRAPDYGPLELHPTAGATVVGVRFPLIAYNINLNTTNLDVAKRIAKAIRFRDGGYRYAKALGFELKEQGCVQVSINMTNYLATPLHRVFETVKREAERYGVMVRESEIVGLTPLRALLDSAIYYLQLDTFKPEQILESRLEASSGDALDQFVSDVAAPTPTPGGGSVAAVSGALGTALFSMVAGLTVGKKGYEAVQDEMKAVQAALAPMHAQFISLTKADAQAFDRVMAAYKLPKSTEEEKSHRSQAIQDATKGACAVPLQVMSLSLEALKLGAVLAVKGNRNSISDVGVGAHCLRTAIQGAGLNVAINLPGIKDHEYVSRTRADSHQMLAEAQRLTGEIDRAVAQIIGS